jgi:hypothetical protein
MPPTARELRKRCEELLERVRASTPELEADEIARHYIETWEREHGWTPKPGQVRLAVVAERLAEKYLGPKRPTLTLIRGGGGDAR